MIQILHYVCNIIIHSYTVNFDESDYIRTDNLCDGLSRHVTFNDFTRAPHDAGPPWEATVPVFGGLQTDRKFESIRACGNFPQLNLLASCAADGMDAYAHCNQRLLLMRVQCILDTPPPLRCQIRSKSSRLNSYHYVW